jgi:hypothetical protein
VSGDIVNLRRARKAKQRIAEADAAAQNRVLFGQSKTQRALGETLDTLETRRFEAHRRDTAVDQSPSSQEGTGTKPDGN